MKPKTTLAKPAATTTIADGKRQWIATKAIDPHPHNRQITPESCQGLADSMRSHGQIQPVTVRPHPTKADRYQLGAGARRWHAAKLAGLSLDCIVRDLSDAEIEAMLAIENLQRENPEPRQEAAQIRRLSELPGSTPETIAAMLGRPDAWVKRRMRLCALIDTVHESWQDPESSIHNLPIATMELVAALSPELQEHFRAEWVVDDFESPSHTEVVRWLSGLSCSLKDAKWLDNPATFIEGCGPGGCATSSAATDLFSNTEFADAKQTQCARCLNPACFNKRKDLARNAEWQAAIAKAPKGFYAVGQSYDPDPVTLADGSILKLRNQWAFHNWTTAKKSDPAAEPFLEEENGKVKLTWKIAPPVTANSKPLPKPAAAQADIKDPAVTLQASIDRVNGKRYSLVLAELKEHLTKSEIPLPDPDPRFSPAEQLAERMLKLAATFGTISAAKSACTTINEYNSDIPDDDEEEDDDGEKKRAAWQPELTAWQEFRQFTPQTAAERLWRQVRQVLLHRLETRSFTDRKCDLIKPEFISELQHISKLTSFDFAAAYVRAAGTCTPPSTLKHLNPITLQ